MKSAKLARVPSPVATGRRRLARISTAALGLTAASAGVGMIATPAADADAAQCTKSVYNYRCTHSYYNAGSGFANNHYDGFNRSLIANSLYHSDTGNSACVQEVVHPGKGSAFNDGAKCGKASVVGHTLNGANLDKGFCRQNGAPGELYCVDTWFAPSAIGDFRY
jgi:hypothetical protein